MKYTIRTVSSITGLSQYTIRAWERRHHVLAPSRTETNRRIYDDSDLERLQILKHIVDAGYGIGQASQLTNEELNKLGDRIGDSHDPMVIEAGPVSITTLYDACVSSMILLDESKFRYSLDRSAAILGVAQFVEQIVIPLLKHIEYGWIEKSITIAQEHMVSAVLRTSLDQIRMSIPAASNAHKLLITTPKGQIHELGAQIISVIAGLESWQVTYLGPNLPAEEIAGAAIQSGANAIALSLVYPDGDKNVESELILLREKVGPAFPILVGGRVAHTYVSKLLAYGFLECYEISEFRLHLASLAKKSRRGS